MRHYVLGILMVLLASPTWAAEAGKVVLSLGKNVAQLPDQQARSLKRKSLIFSQDIVTTGAKGQLQLKFTDGSRLSLRSATQFKVEEYNFDSTEPEKGKSIYRLLKGGMRTITGAISDANVDQYKVNTPIATIGVRGTHYELFFCDKACAKSQQGEYGLYGQVLEGAIFIASGDEVHDIVAGTHFFLGGDNRLQTSSKPLSRAFLPQGAEHLMQSEVPALQVNPTPEFEKSPSLNQTPATPATPSPDPYRPGALK
jgi:hypothetical protein